MVKSILDKRLILLLITLLSACATATPPPNPDGPILTGFDALPKALATIPLSPTPDSLQVTSTVDTHVPTATDAPPTFTPTATPLVGVFMGVATQPAVDGTFQWIPTHGPRIVILTLKPGARPTAASVAINPSGSSPAPIAVQPTVAGGVTRACNVPLASQFANAYAHNAAAQARIGCPLTNGYGLKLVTQSFQNGVMFWRETKEIYALSTANTFWRVADTWNDSIPPSDPALAPPAGLRQPIRGFGYAWRSNPAIRNGLGWALTDEQQFDGFWQDFEHGFMVTGTGGVVYALAPSDGPPATTGQHFGAMPQ